MTVSRADDTPEGQEGKEATRMEIKADSIDSRTAPTVAPTAATIVEFPDRLGAAMRLQRTDMICEKHPHKPWPHADPTEADGECAGPGMPR